MCRTRGATQLSTDMANLSPKARFLLVKKFIADHRNMVDTDAFQRAIDCAEAQYVHRLCELAPTSISASSNEIAAAACFQRIMGMHEFVGIMRNLSETPPKPVATESDNLKQTK